MYLYQDLNSCRNSFKIPASGKETEKMKTALNKSCKNVGLNANGYHVFFVQR
jgi:hypothetical protein